MFALIFVLLLKREILYAKCDIDQHILLDVQLNI